jgi:hypothetical protein
VNIMGFMGRVEISIPLVTWRDGRPRYWPSAAHRRLGYRGEDLRHGKSGPWFTLDEAVRWSDTRVEEIEAKRARVAAGETTPKILRQAQDRQRLASVVTVSQLVEAFLDNPRMKGVGLVDGRKRRKPLAAATVRGYKGSARLLEKFDGGAVWHQPAGDVTAKVLAGILDRVEVKHGLAQTRAVRAMLSASFGWGASKAGGYRVARNPVADLEETLPVLEQRVRIGSVAEMTHFVAVCDALGFSDVGDSIVLGLYTAQRQADRLALEDHKITGEGITFNQRKKGGAPLLIPMIEILRDRLAAAQARRRPWRLNHAHVLIDEHLRRPWAADWYRKVFRVLRHAAATGALSPVEGSPGLTAVDAKVARLMFGRPAEAGKPDGASAVGGRPAGAPASAASDTAREAEEFVSIRLARAGLEPMPSLATFRDQDLRDTAVTWLALADCTKWEIASITGHSLKTIDEILKHYFGAHPELARSGMAKMAAWRRTAR